MKPIQSRGLGSTLTAGVAAGCIDVNLFEDLRDPVYRYLVAVFGRPGEAEDITQEAFLRLYRAMRQGEAVRHARSWIFRVAHNIAFTQIKHDRFAESLDAPSWEALGRTREAGGLNPEQGALEREQATRFQAGLLRLSPQQRQCLLLRVEGFRYREIAEILDVSTSTVAESLRRGINKLMRDIHG
jgi:RNA polymerase sigma-70 factor (ECF subfamily)